MLKISVLALSVALMMGCSALMAQADEAYPICDQIKPAIAAAQEDTPFKSMSDRTRNNESMGYFPAYPALGLEEKHNCFVYIAGTPEGVRGGGKFNYVECDTYRSPFDVQLDMPAASPEREKIGGMLGTCTALRGWIYSAPDTSGREWSDTWTDPETGTQVLARQLESRTGSKRRGVPARKKQEVSLMIRKPNPSYVDPDEAFRRSQEAAAASE